MGSNPVALSPFYVTKVGQTQGKRPEASLCSPLQFSFCSYKSSNGETAHLNFSFPGIFLPN